MAKVVKVKTSVTLPKDLLGAVDGLQGPYKNRSELIEVALRAFIAAMHRQESDAHDLEIINQHADELNAEALDVLDYQLAL